MLKYSCSLLCLLQIFHRNTSCNAHASILICYRHKFQDKVNLWSKMESASKTKLNFSTLLVCILPHCRLRTDVVICGKTAVTWFDASTNQRHSAFWFHILLSAFRNSAFYRIADRRRAKICDAFSSWVKLSGSMPQGSLLGARLQ